MKIRSYDELVTRNPVWEKQLLLNLSEEEAQDLVSFFSDFSITKTEREGKTFANFKHLLRHELSAEKKVPESSRQKTETPITFAPGTPLTLKHDFGDGRGLVPGHRHVNETGAQGGWVADTAHVADTVHISSKAKVYGYAIVRDYVKIYDYAEVCGFAEVYGNVRLSGKAKVMGTASLNGTTVISGTTVITG